MVIALVSLLLLPLVLQRLGLTLFGVISLTLLFGEIASIVDFGLSKSIVLLSGEKKLSENKVVTSALYINLLLITILSIFFIVFQLLSIDLLGKNLNIPSNEKLILLNVGFLLLVVSMLNNSCRAILESNYLMHIINITFSIYTPLLFSIIFIASFFTKNMIFYMITPLVLTMIMLFFNILIIKKRTRVRFVKIKLINLKYVAKNTISFLKIELLNSMIIPVLRYAFVLLVADIGLYAIFDLSFKIALLANSIIASLSIPMFAVFSNNAQKSKKMIQISFKIFGISLSLYILMLLAFYFLGDFLILILDLSTEHKDLLYVITFILLTSLGSVSVVEVFYRYFLGNNQLKKAFLLKLIIPIGSIIFFLIFNGFDLIYRFIYAYGASLILSSILILITFSLQSKPKPEETV